MTRTVGLRTAIVVAALTAFPLTVAAQFGMPAGRSIGKVSTAGHLIVLQLDEGALGKENLFNLEGRTVRFTPDGPQYRVDTLALKWDAEFGSEVANQQIELHKFTFPFSGTNWSFLQAGARGWIAFGKKKTTESAANRFQRDAVSIGRFDPLAEAGATLINSVPAICVFFKPRMSGRVYAKELADSLVITWDVTEPFGNIQDFTWYKTVNLFQAVLHRNGEIDMSYKQLAARDAIVGVYPKLPETEKPLATIPGPGQTSPAPYLDVQRVKLSIIDGILLRVAFETRGPIPPEGDPAAKGIGFRVVLENPNKGNGNSQRAVRWTAEGVGPEDSPTGKPTYFAYGRGVSHNARVRGNSIALQGVLPASLREAGQITVSAEVLSEKNITGPIGRLGPQSIQLAGLQNPEVHFSSATSKDGPFAVVYEAFHYGASPRATDLSCTVIKALGDKFDFLAYYSDFRIDNQEAGTPSDGPVGGNVTGIAQVQHDFDAYCTQGRFQWEYVQPVYVDANQMQEYPPADAPVGNDHDITFYRQQLEESTPDRKMLPYNYAMSQLGHEMGHRWAAFVSAKVNGEVIPLGPVHWARGLQAPVAFPYQRPTEASAMGGGVWQDNFDGTYTQLDDDYYVPATGYSYLDLYLMGLISPAEVPDFFLLRNLAPTGKGANGHPIFKADRTKITIQDVIAQEGPRQPDVNHSQREFNTGMVLVVAHGKMPSRELIDRVTGIRSQWIEYWSRATGNRASMTADVR